MSCPMNKKRWWFFRWEGSHDVSRHNVSKVRTGLWRYTKHCSLCGDVQWYSADHQDMVRMKLITPDGKVIPQEGDDD